MQLMIPKDMVRTSVASPDVARPGLPFASKILIGSAASAVLAVAAAGLALTFGSSAAIGFEPVAKSSSSGGLAPLSRSIPAEASQIPPQPVATEANVPIFRMPDEALNSGAGRHGQRPETESYVAADSAARMPYEGRWYAKYHADCYNGTDDSERVPLRFTSSNLKFYETSCNVRSVRRLGGRFNLKSKCTFEGIYSESNITLDFVDADTMRVNAYEAAGIDGALYKRCKPKQNAHALPSAPNAERTAASHPKRPRRSEVERCSGVFIRDSCGPNKIGCSVPKKAGDTADFMASDQTDGVRTYVVYRMDHYAASDVRLEPNCRLPSYNIDSEIRRRQSNLRMIDQILSGRP
ncbi:hypothetical protein BHAOGJBA_1352 [Methylobacterium hispanicum]|uniref:Uncharacterized protein n=1 Tax=Methylobacterium hispanicum TaxID=270350 RepID=A0AAV4ZHI0_9HYPH|nr:hypothetical protein [Methylobacterium hispanicum]GJD87847.1 hypothetical protein BHAOGJBA_1352 [Methylobacterium hispanicum]